MSLTNIILLSILNMIKDLKYIGLQLCTCTWIEIMTGIGISLYMLYLHSYMLAVLTAALFVPLIGSHFVLSKISQSEDCHTLSCRFKYSNYSAKYHSK